MRSAPSRSTIAAAYEATFGHTAGEGLRLFFEVSIRLRSWVPTVEWVGEHDYAPGDQPSPLRDLVEWYKSTVTRIHATEGPPEAGIDRLAVHLDAAEGYELRRMTQGYCAFRVAEEFARLKQCVLTDAAPVTGRTALNRLELTYGMALRQFSVPESTLRRTHDRRRSAGLPAVGLRAS